MTHTPGPWKAVPVGMFGEYEIHAGGKDIAAINVSDGMDEPTAFPAEANARLIAAAPDLLEACAEAAARLRYSGDHFHDCGAETRANADWAASEACLAAISRANTTQG